MSGDALRRVVGEGLLQGARENPQVKGRAIAGQQVLVVYPMIYLFTTQKHRLLGSGLLAKMQPPTPR